MRLIDGGNLAWVSLSLVRALAYIHPFNQFGCDICSRVSINTSGETLRCPYFGSSSTVSKDYHRTLGPPGLVAVVDVRSCLSHGSTETRHPIYEPHHDYQSSFKLTGPKYLRISSDSTW